VTGRADTSEEELMTPPREDDVPTIGVRAFAAELKAQREARGWTQAETADRMGYSQSVVGKLEGCTVRPSEMHAQKADEAFGLPSTFQRLRESLLVMPAYPDWFRGWPGKEAEATELRWYEPLIVPGLLQTEAYARTLLRTRVGVTEDEFEAMLAARLERQVILARPKPPTLWVLLDEGVLHRPVGDAQVMHEQVSYLAAAARRPNIVVQVVPRSVGAYEGLRGPLVLASFAGGPDVALQDAAVYGSVVESGAGVAAARAAWEATKSEALSRSASIDLIEKVAEQWT
jgi:transcriptional regulator with XRE-family HTH domain